MGQNGSGGVSNTNGLKMENDKSTDIALIFQKLETIEKYIKDERDLFKDHVKSSNDFREKVTRHEEQIKAIRAEMVLVKWMFGIVIGVGVAILGKLINVY